MIPRTIYKFLCLCTGAFAEKIPLSIKGRDRRGIAVEAKDEKEPKDAWGRWRKVLMVALFTTISFLTSIAYFVVGSFFPVKVNVLGIAATGVLVFVSKGGEQCSLYS